MGSNQPQLMGRIEPPRDNLVVENAQLKAEIARLRQAFEELKSQDTKTLRVLNNLRTVLFPLFNSLQGVFGNLDEVDFGDPYNPLTSSPGQAAAAPKKVEAYLQRFPGKPSEVIKALSDIGPMDSKQLAAVLRWDKRTVANHIFTLTKAGVVTKNGSVFSLR